jgi:hypothetical protein
MLIMFGFIVGFAWFFSGFSECRVFAMGETGGRDGKNLEWCECERNREYEYEQEHEHES